MYKQLKTDHLLVGMYIAQLDRPWLETPFMFQGFFLNHEKDILEVQQHCDYVFIDIIKGIDTEIKLPPERIFTRIPNPDGTSPTSKETPLEEEITVATDIRKTAMTCIEDVFRLILQGQQLDVSDIKVVISDLVSSIVRNPNAQMCLTQLKKKDEYTAQHSINVCVLTVAFCRFLGMDEYTLNQIGLGALLHDIGKMKTPQEVLNKPGKLTAEEFEMMKDHPKHGREILENTGGIPKDVIEIVFSHHERPAGHGYPMGLASDRISSWSKIVAIIDVYDAITSDRCYRNGLSPTQALSKMYDLRSNDFDSELLEQFIRCIGLFPIGSLVETKNGRVGIVISVNPEKRLKPKLMLILDEHKNPYFPTRIIDLALTGSNPGDADFNIATTLEPGAYNININEYISEIHNAQKVSPG